MVPGNASDGFALRVKSAGLWHRRMGHINGKSLDVLRKEPTNVVDYTGDVVSARSVRVHKNRILSRPTMAFCAPSSTFPSTPSAPSRLQRWAVSSTPPSSLISRPSGKR